MQSHPIYTKQDGTVSVIQLYYDSVEPPVVLGSNKGKHEIGVFYTTLLIIKPKIRSSLRSINVLGIMNSNILKKMEPKNFFSHFQKTCLIYNLELN